MTNRIGVLALFIAVAALGQTKWAPETIMQVKAVSNVRVSPDGLRVAFTVGEAVMTEESSETLRQIWLAKSDGSESVPLTFGEKSSTDPRWLPDSSGLVFNSKRSGTSQLYLLRLRGGEAEPLTSGKLEVQTFAISPDGQQIAFTASDVKEDEEKRAKAKEDYRWIDEDLSPKRLYVVPIQKAANGKREPRKLVAGNFNVGVADNATNIDWSPDGKWIVFDRTKSPRANDWPTADVAMVNVDSGEIRNLAATPAAEMAPHFSPDGKWVAIQVSDNPPTWGGVTRVQLLNVNTGEKKEIPSTPDANADIVGFSNDGKQIWVGETRGTTDRLYAIDVASNRIADVNSLGEVFTEANLNRTTTYFGLSVQAPDRPPEAFVTRTDHFAPVQVSHVNETIAKLPMPKTEVVRWKAKDGLDIEGLLTYPLNYTSGKRVPLLLVIHGGPSGVFRQTFVGNYSPFPVAVFASNGYAVLRANPRGSSGYGQKFRYANYRDWGGGDYNDLMSGVDTVIARGIADPDRLGVMGWSYGGFMTSWVITHTNRFKAATVGAGVTDLLSFTGTSDIPAFLPDYFGGPFWETFDLWKEHSPIVYVKQVRTPTLIEHGEADERVPISQGYELYNALKTQGVPVRMIVFPRQHHGLSEPKMRLQAMKANIEWFDRWLGGTKP
jgi:dipeptidyl aminopeptidase/acylaminoacyl peptidase